MSYVLQSPNKTLDIRGKIQDGTHIAKTIETAIGVLKTMALKKS